MLLIRTQVLLQIQSLRIPYGQVNKQHNEKTGWPDGFWLKPLLSIVDGLYIPVSASIALTGSTALCGSAGS